MAQIGHMPNSCFAFRSLGEFNAAKPLPQNQPGARRNDRFIHAITPWHHGSRNTDKPARLGNLRRQCLPDGANRARSAPQNMNMEVTMYDSRGMPGINGAATRPKMGNGVHWVSRQQLALRNQRLTSNLMMILRQQIASAPAADRTACQPAMARHRLRSQLPAAIEAR